MGGGAVKRLQIFLFFCCAAGYFIGCAPSAQKLIERDIQEGNFRSAEAMVRAILENNPHDCRAHYYLGQCQLAIGDTVEAMNSLKTAIGLDDFPEPYLELAKVNFALRRLDQARRDIEEAVEISGKESPQIVELRAGIDEAKAEAKEKHDLGMETYRKNDFSRAAGCFKQAHEINRDDTETLYYMNMARGLALYHKGVTDAYWDAILEFGKAAQIKPNRGEPHYLMGVCYQQKDPNDFSNPINEYRKALELELRDDYRAKLIPKLEALEARRRKLDEFWGK